MYARFKHSKARDFALPQRAVGVESIVQLHFKDETERVKRLKQAMSPGVRSRIVPVATRRVFNFIQRHFASYARTHHASADALGAPHTKHMERAARDMSHEANAEVGHVILGMAGIGRARHDVDIVKKDRRLTLPIARESYGRSAREMEEKFGKGSLFVFRSKAGNAILAAQKRQGKRRITLPLYVLKDRVHQRQDPSMLPSEEAISEETHAALRECIDKYLGG